MEREDKQEKRENRRTQKQRADGKEGGETKRDRDSGREEKNVRQCLVSLANSTLGSQPHGARTPLPHLPGLPTLRSFPPFCKSVLVSPPGNHELKDRDPVIGALPATFE